MGAVVVDAAARRATNIPVSLSLLARGAHADARFFAIDSWGATAAADELRFEEA